MDQITTDAARAALIKMATQGHFSISTVRNIAAMLDLPKPGGRSFRILETLHCVDYADMTPELRAALPQLISDCLRDALGRTPFNVQQALAVLK